MSGSLVLLDVADGVATLTLNRPERKNGITPELVEELIGVLTSVPANDDIRALVVTGAGDAFCSGMDLGAAIPENTAAFMRRVGSACSLLHALPVPTISRVHGAAVGFGANFALCADLVLVAPQATFSEIFTQRGLSVDGGGTWLLPRAIGPAKTKELLFFGERVTGREAAELGIANRCAEDADALDELVGTWASRLAAGPRRALASIKGLVNAAGQRSLADALEAEAVAQALAFRSPELKEGMRAFFEKRAPDFRDS